MVTTALNMGYSWLFKMTLEDRVKQKGICFLINLILFNTVQSAVQAVILNF